MKEKLEFLFLMIFYLFSKLFGIRVSSFTGGILLWLYGFFSSRNIIALKNLNHVYPAKNLKEKKIIIQKMWFHFGRIIGEFPHLHKIKVKNNKSIKVIGIQNLLNPLKKNKNCIYFSAHIGNWELSSHPLIQNGHKINFVYRAPNNKLIDRILRKLRLDYGVKLIKKGKEGAKECIKSLKNNENLGMLIDQKMNDGIPVNFFNKKAMTATAIAKLALKFQCPIVPAFCIRERGIYFRIEYLKPITYKFIKKLGTEEKILEYLNKIIESWVLSYPEQWIWVHDRWKS